MQRLVPGPSTTNVAGPGSIRMLSHASPSPQLYKNRRNLQPALLPQTTRYDPGRLDPPYP